MTTMVHAGYLKKEGGEFLIKGGAAALFFSHRDKIIKKLKQERPDDAIFYDALPTSEQLKNRDVFPTFNRNWIDGIVTFCLNALNQTPSVSEVLIPDKDKQNAPPVIIYDPYFVFDNEAYTPPPQLSDPTLDINGIKTYFGFTTLGGSTTAYNTSIAVLYKLVGPPGSPTDPLSYVAKIPAFLGALPKYEKPKLENFTPEFPSEDFPDLDYGDSENLNLPDKQTQLTKSIIDSLDELVTLLRTTAVAYLEPISTAPITVENSGPLNAIYDLARGVIKKNFPTPLAEAITNELNYLTLQELLVKPMVLASIGVIFGSSEKGFVAKMKVIAPDDVGNYNDKPEFPDPKPLKLNLTEVVESESQGSTTPINITGTSIEEIRVDNPSELSDSKKTIFTLKDLLNAFFNVDSSLRELKSNSNLFKNMAGQIAFESGADEISATYSPYDYILGGIKYAKGWPVTYKEKPTTERLTLEACNSIKGSWLPGESPVDSGVKDKKGNTLYNIRVKQKFVAFRNLDDAARFYLWFIKRTGNNSKIFAVAASQGPESYALFLKSVGYYTGAESKYQKGIRNYYNKFGPEIEQYLASK